MTVPYTFATASGPLPLSQLDANFAAVGQSANISYTLSSANAVVRTASSKMSDVVSVKDFGAVGNGIADDTAAIQSAINAVTTTSGIVTFPVGTFLVSSSISLLGKYVTLQGAGMVNTVIKASSSMTSVIEIGESSDVQLSPFVISDLKINGNSLATNGINVRYRHQSVIRNTYIVGCTVGLKEKDAWINYRENVRCDNNATGIYLVGSNHNSEFNRCTVTNSSTVGFNIQSSGTVADGNLALLFNACDVEYCSGQGIIFNGSSATFESCYIGEGVSGAIFTMTAGNVYVNGGYFLFGYTVNSYGYVLNGGNVFHNGGIVSNQGALGVSGQVVGNGGKVVFTNNALTESWGGNPVWTGDGLGYGPAATVFAPRYGSQYTGASYSNNIPISVTTPGSYPYAKTITATGSATGSPAIIELQATLINQGGWKIGDTLALIVVYSSNVTVNIHVSSSQWGGTPLIDLGTLPSTSGTIKTAIKADVNWGTGSYTILEFYNDSPSNGSTFTIHEAYLTDASFMSPYGGNVLNNIYKC